MKKQVFRTSLTHMLRQGYHAGRMAHALHEALADYYDSRTDTYVLPSMAHMREALGYDPRNHTGSRL